MKIPVPDQTGVWTLKGARELLCYLGFVFERSTETYVFYVGGDTDLHVIAEVTWDMIKESPDAIGEYFLDWVLPQPE